MADPAAAASISNNPVAFLTPLVSGAPSPVSLERLAGATAAYLQEQTDPSIGAMYLAAAARHMPSCDPETTGLQPHHRLDIVEVSQ
jgi:hypothetical protein